MRSLRIIPWMELFTYPDPDGKCIQDLCSDTLLRQRAACGPLETWVQQTQLNHIMRVLHHMSLSVFGLIDTFVTCYCPPCLSTQGKSRDPGVLFRPLLSPKGMEIRADMAHAPSYRTDMKEGQR